MQVAWRAGERTTAARFEDPGLMLLGQGTVRRNLESPPAGGCRTSVEIEMDGHEPGACVLGFHHVHVVGEHEHLLRAWCRLAGVDARSIWRAP
jgi:hypothetical protein